MATDWVSGNIFIRVLDFGGKAGGVVDGHTHNFAHTTYIVRGTVLVESLNADDTVKQAVTKKASDGYNWVLIKAGVKHRLTALTDDAVGHCIYSHRNPQEEVVQDYDGWTPAYQ